ADNKTLSAKLAEKIAEERAKALLKSVDAKKRRDNEDGAAVVDSGEDKASGGSKKRQRMKSKSKSKQG
ncbi:hypothetical protein E4U55_001481, partial [Claviceps digitariae]